MTKKQAHRAANEAWRLALAERRVIRVGPRGNRSLVSYPTVEKRDAAIGEARHAGMEPEIVVPEES
jgi:hypothetical protein